MLVYLTRHFQTGVDESNPRKKHPKTNLSSKGRKEGQEAVKFFKNKEIGGIYSGTFIRSNESAFIARDEINRHQENKLEVISTPLLDEWSIPSIWGKKIKDLEDYFTWRKKVFREALIDKSFDSDSESLLDLYKIRVPKVLDLLKKGHGNNKLVCTHSQLITTILSYISEEAKVNASDIIRNFGLYFPKRYGAIATIEYETKTDQWSILEHNYIDHLPKADQK